jgi:hypothetical protein
MKIYEYMSKQPIRLPRLALALISWTVLYEESVLVPLVPRLIASFGLRRCQYSPIDIR